LINALCGLLLFQLLGEVASQALALPVPGPVVGMVLLAVFLVWRGAMSEELEQAAGFLLRHLSLFFVPAAVGVIANGARIAREWLPLGASLIGSTVLTIGVTAAVFRGVDRLAGRP
jgi:holin-like protein